MYNNYMTAMRDDVNLLLFPFLTTKPRFDVKKNIMQK